MTITRSSRFTRYCAAVLSATLVLQPLGAYAATITTSNLAEIPIQGSNPVKPNIMYTLDESGSMALATLPDYVNNQLAPTYSGAPSPGPFALGDDRYSYSWCLGNAGESVLCAFTSPPLASSQMNHIYYDPAVQYMNGKKSDGTDLSCEGSNALCDGPWTAVYSDGFAGYPNANSGGSINLLTGYPDEAFCSIASPTSADLATARSSGSVCRFNGVTYGGSTGYRYPGAGYTFRTATTGNPYYYSITSLQFCASRDANGWGTGTCTPQWSSTNRYISYGAGGFDPAAFARVDITTFAGTNAYGRTYAQEMANFAKWYAFARSRMLAMKTAGGIAFSALDANSRVGFNTLNSFATKFLNVQDFTDANKITWFTNFYSVAPSGITPSINAMWRVGEYFSNRGVAAGLPGATDPLNTDAGKCQPNFHLMSTDGYWNQAVVARSGVAGAIGNQDLNVPATLPGPIPGFSPGQPFPLPYREGAGANSTSDTMADMGMYYWINDLRPDKPDQVKDSIAPWQHLTFYGLSIGAEGTLPYPTGVNSVISGATPWPKPASLTPAAIDDLWHAAINSRGKYFNAQNAQQLAESVVSALSDFTDQAGTGTAVGLSGAQLTVSTHFGYKTSYEIGWWGDVKKYALDPSTGALPVDAGGNPLNPPLWSAATQLNAQALGTGWDTNRRIVTINDSGVGVPFRLATLTGTQSSSLANTWANVVSPPSAQQVLNYLRGDQSNEGVGTTNFRIRSQILGDLVTSAAVPVGAPNRPYEDAGNPGYKAFSVLKAARTSMVYVGGNDGMLHAFDDSNTTNAGMETWAFIPRALFSAEDPNDTSRTPSPGFQIGASSYRRGGIPLFKHRFYVNATPRVWDIDFANTNTSTPPQTGNDWRTILVGGLGAGGRAVYALDVTNPVVSTESEADVATSGRVLWEFTDTNLGYVFDAPTLVKTQRYGWVVLVASGYNNPGGKGILYVLNPTDGAILQTLSTGVGSDVDPSGLATIRAYTASRKDPYVLQAYGGDLKGNVWRFDLSDPDPASWKVELIAKLTDPNGNAQPITTGVRVEIDQNNNVDRYLFVGTGKLLGQQDLLDTTVANTLYVIRDGTRTAAGTAPTPAYSRADLNSVNGTGVAGFSGTATGRGWYQDAGDPKLKIVTDVTADVQTVVYAFSKPSDDPCEAALTSTLYARDFTTGNSVLESPGGTVVWGIADVGAIAGVTLIQGQGGGASSASSGDVRVQVTTMKGQVFSFGVKLAGAANLKHRVSWRLLNRD